MSTIRFIIAAVLISVLGLMGGCGRSGDNQDNLVLVNSNASTPETTSAPEAVSNENQEAVSSSDPPPQIETVSPADVTLEVMTGENLTLSVAATDPEGDLLSYTWSAPAGEFSAVNEPDTVWTAPQEAANITLTLQIEDSQGNLVESLWEITVIAEEASATPAASTTTTTVTVTDAIVDTWLSWDIQGPQAPNDIYLACDPPAGYIRLAFGEPVSNSPASLADENFIILQGNLNGSDCMLTNTADPIIKFSRFGADRKEIYLYCSNLWLIDDGDLLSITGADPDDDLGLMDLSGNPARLSSMIRINDLLGPAIHSVALNERNYEPDSGEREPEDYDLITVTFTEELCAVADTIGRYEVGGTYISTWQAQYGAQPAQTQIVAKLGGVTYPTYTYDPVSGEATVTMLFPDGTLDRVASGDNLNLLNTPPRMDWVGNPLLNVDTVVLDADHGDQANFRAWNDLTDNVKPKIKDHDPDGDGVADLDGQSVFSDGRAADFSLQITFSEPVNLAELDISINNWTNDSDWSIDDFHPNHRNAAEHAASLSTTTLTIDFVYDGGGGAVTEGDSVELDGVYDLMGNALCNSTTEVVASSAGQDPIIE